VEGSSTYIIYHCPERIKERINNKIKDMAASKGNDLMVIDYIIVNEVAGSWHGKIHDVYNQLLAYVSPTPSPVACLSPSSYPGC
jgi:hypothetical protein